MPKVAQLDMSQPAFPVLFFRSLNVSVSTEATQANQLFLLDHGLLVEIVYGKLFMFEAIFEVK